MKYLKYLLLVFFLVLSFSLNNKVEAKTLKDLKTELSAAEAKYSKNQNDKNQTQASISETKEKISSITSQKVQISRETESLNSDIKKLGDQILVMQQEIKNIIHYYQLSSTNSLYLEYVFNASDFTDFIYRLAVSEQLSEYRERTIKEYNNLMEQNRKKLNELSQKQTVLNGLEKELSTELSKLDENLSDIVEVSVDVQAEIKELKNSINTYETKYKCPLNQEISVCVNNYNKRRKHSSGSSSGGNFGSMPSAAGFYRPVKYGRINANYGYTDYYGSFHDGMDIGVSHGTPVYAVAIGTVMKISRKSSCGGNMVYIGHYTSRGTYTSGYFHLSRINVSEGQTVNQNTVIGYSGGVPSIETWDRCSTGAHLHLQMGTGIYMSDYFFYSNYAARKFNPRNLINFPAMGRSFSGR